MAQARARLSSTVREIIKEREKEINAGLKVDFLDVILSKRRLTDEETVSIVLDILLGGYETTSTLISLIVYFLGHAPAAFETLKVFLFLYIYLCSYYRPPKIFLSLTFFPLSFQ